MEKLNVGVIGLGQRGSMLISGCLIPMEDVNITAVCDLYQDRVDDNAAKIKESEGHDVFGTLDYRELLTRSDVDAVLISASWEVHIPIAIDALNQGKFVGLEVGGAYSTESCWDLVRASERAGGKFIFLENCCYGQRELMVTNMVRNGLFGEVVHCEGAYKHDLRQEISSGEEIRHYRLRNYIARNCENYPTHELGPIAKLMDINRGNRMISLSSMASCAKGLHEYATLKHGIDSNLAKINFRQGDVVNTNILLAGGETIALTLSTSLPRSYSRSFTVQGTKGMYQEDGDFVYIDGVHNHAEWNQKVIWNNAEEYAEKYNNVLWRDYEIKGGHGGMDWHVIRAFVESAKCNIDSPIDVYDAASWMVISSLSEESIAAGGMPVAIPDFTNGRWVIDKRKNEGNSDYFV